MWFESMSTISKVNLPSWNISPVSGILPAWDKINPAMVVYPSSTSLGISFSISNKSLKSSIENLPSINQELSFLSIALGSSSSSIPGMSPTIPSRRSFNVINPTTLPNSSTTRTIWTYSLFSLNSWSKSIESIFSGTTNGDLMLALISTSSPKKISLNRSFAWTTPIKSSNSPSATGKIDLLLFMILSLFSSKLSSKSNQMISLLGVIIISTFWSSKRNTLLMMSSSSSAIVPSSIPSSISNLTSSSVTRSSFGDEPTSFKARFVELSSNFTIGLQIMELICMNLAVLNAYPSGSFNAILLGTISPTNIVK